MEYKQIQELIKTINKSNISELTIEEGEFKITIKQEQAGPAQFVSMPQAPVHMRRQPAANGPATGSPTPQLLHLLQKNQQHL